MVAYATSYETGSPWAGVVAAAFAGLLLGGLHGAICSLDRVNDVAMGIAIMLAVLVGMAALAIDGSRAYAARRDLQAAVDSAALAAADKLQQGGTYLPLIPI